MPHLAIILVSAQISPGRYLITTHHGSKAGRQRAAEVIMEVASVARGLSVTQQIVQPIEPTLLEEPCAT